MIIVDPAQVRAVDKLRFNILAEDVGLEFDNLMLGLSTRLTDNREECGDRRTTYKDYHHPIIVEFSLTEDGLVYASTEILITRDNAYSYAFFAGGGWRACSDCKNHYIVRGATSAGFRSSYQGLVMKEMGPEKVINAIFSLASSTTSGWKKSFRHLCFMFIESVRLIEFGDFVRGTLVNGAQLSMMYSYPELTPSNIGKQPNHWGQASDALRGFFLHPPFGTNWNVSSDVLSVFGTTPAYEAERAAADGVDDEHCHCFG